MTAEILCVGTELLLGEVLNTNTSFIARELANLGINVYKQGVIGDNRQRLLDELERSFSESDLLVLTGGLGPTYDDITKEVVSEYFGIKEVLHEESLARIKTFFEKMNKKMTENNVKQAMVPEGSVVLRNDYGTAPGIIVTKDGKTAILLPGPPFEMKPMFMNSVVPFLLKDSGQIFYSSHVKIFGRGESEIENDIRDYAESRTNPTVAPYAANGEVYLRITAKAENVEKAKALNMSVITDLQKMIGEYVYGIDIPDLQTALVNMLIENRLTLSTAESCTGGLISKKITDVAGSSEIFIGGACTYANEAKMKLLGVSESTLEKHGAVSPETAEEMVKGVRELFGTDLAAATTGIAGPGGGSDEKPVSLVYIGIYAFGKTYVYKKNLGRNTNDAREKIREQASKWVLKYLIDAVKKEKGL